MTQQRYRLDRRIATGGMGVVWRATDTVLERQVAVKVLKPEYADDPTFRSRFEAEARNAAALHHHNVASVLDFGELDPADGSGVPRPYLVMELVPGRPLSTLLRDEEPMLPETAADLGAQAADALGAAHAMGIVHRDVKPGNLLVTPRGRVKITDFGIARAADGAALTQTGQVIGTPAYISPEQAEGHPATPASDLYSLGVVLYECLSGRRPFGGDTPVSTALAHLRDAPPPLPETVPAHLRDVVSIALAKDPEQRFASMAELASALRGGPVAVPVPAEPGPAELGPEEPGSTGREPDTRVIAPVASGRERRGWLPWVGVACTVLLVVATLSWLTRGDEVAAPAAATPDGSPSASSASADSRFRVRAKDYVGLSADEARARLEDHDLRVRQRMVANPGGKRAGHVAGVSPTGLVDVHDLITLSVWGPVPEVAEPEPEPRSQPQHAKPKHHGKPKHHSEPPGHKKKGH